MAKVGYLYVLIIFSRILSVGSFGVYHYFYENTYFSNKVLENNLNGTTHSSSLIECATKCDLCCSCFGFNTLTNMCRVFTTCYQDNVVGNEDDWTYYTKNEPVRPTNCLALFKRGCTTGVFTIYPWDELDENFKPVDVFCDMDTADGGWTGLQRRISGSVDFNRTWNEYRIGFGNLNENFWIGNDVIHQLTKTENVSLYVAITLASGETKYHVYHHFSVADVSDKFRLFLQGPSNGTLDDNLGSTYPYCNLLGMFFTTYDQNNYDDGDGNCGLIYGGGWWFRSCYCGYLNGPWKNTRWKEPWHPDVMNATDMHETIMMIRPN